MKEWVNTHLPSEVCYGMGNDAQVAAADLLEGLGAHGFAATLDYTKAYDTMKPQGTVALMRQAGFPEGFCSLCLAVWGTQLRWVQWGEHTHYHPLQAGRATAQGCPMGPLALSLWMASGLNAAKASLPANAFGAVRLFMDDRSFTARTAQDLVAQVETWQRWSESVGLLESQDKTQLTATSTDRRAQLARLWQVPHQVSATFEVLGVCARNGPRRNAPKEDGRLQAATRTVAALGVLGFGFEHFQRVARSYGVSKVCYGWLTRLPTLTDAWRLWSVIRTGQRCLRRANRHLRAILVGGNAHLDILAAGNLVRVLHVLRKRGSLQWHHRTGTPLGALQRWLADRGWTEVGPWRWRGPTPECDLHLGPETRVATAMHSLRQGWRCDQWARFTWNSRHEVAELQHVTSAQLLRFDFDRTRLAMRNSAAYRTVALLSSASPACFQDGRVAFSDRCGWACGGLGHWHHMAWACRCRPSDGRPAGRLGAVQRRLGWVVKGQSQHAAAVMTAWMARVQEQIWEGRYRRHRRGPLA